MQRQQCAERLSCRSMRFFTVLFFLTLLTPLGGQNPPPQQPKEEPARFFGQVNLVTAPVTVTGPDGRLVANLEKQHFRVFDNDDEQVISGFDVSYLPISMVLCVETSGRIEGLLKQIKKSGILYTELVLGESGGEAALITFDSNVNIVQEFSSDHEKLIASLQKIKPGSDATRTADAVWRAIRLLRARPDNRRKVIVLVSESRESGSETSLGESLRDAQLQNILVYGLRLSTAKAKLTQPAQLARDPFPPGVSARPLPPGVISTPTSQVQARVEVVNALPYIIEAVRGVKNLIFNDPMQLLTEGTGGRMQAPVTGGGMEESISRIGEELRTQYLISYRPNNLAKGGFHQIKVEVAWDGLKVRTRPGYWLGPVPVQN